MQFMIEAKQLEILEKDAKRYRWLKDQDRGWILDYMANNNPRRKGSISLDQAIDKAMSKN